MKIKVDVTRLPKAPYSRPKLPEAEAPDRPYENMNWGHKPVTTDSKRIEAYTPDVDAKIIQWHKEGKSFGYMAERLGRSPGGVKARYRRLVAGRFGRKYRYTPEQDAVIREMRAQGKTWREIADHLGRSREAIRHRAQAIL